MYDEIGGWGITAKQFAQDLAACGDVSQINLRIHSPGGDVFVALAGALRMPLTVFLPLLALAKIGRYVVLALATAAAV